MYLTYTEAFAHDKKKYIIYLYHGAWVITTVTFDVPRELYAHNLLADSVKFHSLHNEILNDKLQFTQ